MTDHTHEALLAQIDALTARCAALESELEVRLFDRLGRNILPTQAAEVLETGPDGSRTFKFIEGPVFCQLLMADEINRASPRTQSALLQAMQERRVGKGRAILMNCTLAGIRAGHHEPHGDVAAVVDGHVVDGAVAAAGRPRDEFCGRVQEGQDLDGGAGR
mgnify:CR=1 FL=1